MSLQNVEKKTVSLTYSMAEASGLVRFGKMEVLQRPGSDDARKLLLRVAKQVEPIMQKREWNVGSLIEIIPASP